jgi:hypothetical protein
VASRTDLVPLSTCDTVIGETPAASATEEMVTACRDLREERVTVAIPDPDFWEPSLRFRVICCAK